MHLRPGIEGEGFSAGKLSDIIGMAVSFRFSHTTICYFFVVVSNLWQLWSLTMIYLDSGQRDEFLQDKQISYWFVVLFLKN